jgi:hypothetical protein
MRDARFRKIARLEKFAQPFLERQGDDARQWELTVWGAAHHAAVLVFLIRYGEPQIDEPLSRACERCAASTAWKECCQEFKCWLQRYSGENGFRPHSRDAVTIMGEPLRHFVIASFPGADEKQKLNTAFTTAPPWLLWFTFADYTAKLLNLTIPDLSKVSGFTRSKKFDIWWGLPSGAFERELWPRGRDQEPLARTDLKVRGMTRRELMRERMAFEKSTRDEEHWPDLLPTQVLKLSRIEFLSLNERIQSRARAGHIINKAKI